MEFEPGTTSLEAQSTKTIFNKNSEKVLIKSHNIALNGIRTRYYSLGSPEHYQLTTNATNPTTLVLSI